MMRRKDREMPSTFAEMVVDGCTYAALATTGEHGEPYCVPISMVREGDVLYFHCAPDGEKNANMRRNPEVCVMCVGPTKLVPEHFTLEYESAVVRGRAEEVTDDPEKIHALRLLTLRYAASNMGAFETEVAKSLKLTGVWKIHVASITGKRKKYDSQGKEMKFGKTEPE